MLQVQFPSNSQKIHEVITEIATFQIYQTDSLDAQIYDLHEGDKVPFSTNFELAGYDSRLFITSIGTSWYILHLMILCLLL